VLIGVDGVFDDNIFMFDGVDEITVDEVGVVIKC
jgi:hypothetical protein